MRLSCAFLFVATILVTGSPNFIVAGRDDIPTSISHIEASNVVVSATTSKNDQPARRSLRTGQGTNNDEERAKQLSRMFSDITGDGADTAIRFTRSKSLPSFTDKEKLERLITENDLYKRAIRFYANEKQMTPTEMRDALGIPAKLKSMSMAELSIDQDFIFWRKYIRYWDKHH